MKKIRKILLIALPSILILIIAGGIILYLMLGTILRKGITEVGSRALKAPVTVENISVSAFTGTAGIKGLVIGNPEGVKGIFKRK